jgi:hypothetical protein
VPAPDRGAALDDEDLVVQCDAELGANEGTFGPWTEGPSRRRLGYMAVLTQPRVVRSPPDPWFRRHPALALMVAGVLFALVLSVRMLAESPVDAVSMLYALPVALVATTSGLRAGAAAGLIAVALTVFWAIVRNVSLTPSGWASRVLPLLLLGVLLGHAADRLRIAELGRRRLESAALLHREAIEINDSLVQGMVSAKWLLDAGQMDTGKQILGQTIVRAHDLVSGLISRADMGARTEPLPARLKPEGNPHE